MEGRRRNQVALAVFLALVIAGGIALVGYFFTGRSWSVAATIVDDQVGTMEDYAVVAFSGSASPSPSEAAKPAGEVDVEKTMSDPYSTSSAPSGDDLIERIKSIYQRAEARQEAGSDGVYVSDVRDLYELKGASVLTLNTTDLDYYAKPLVFHTAERTFGVFSVSAYTSRAKTAEIVKGLRDDGAQSIICVAARSALLSTYAGIDVVIFTEESEAAISEIDTGETLAVCTPATGSVGVVLFSSNNIPSFKTIEEL